MLKKAASKAAASKEVRRTLRYVEPSERCENDAGGLFQLPAEPLLVIGFTEKMLYTAQNTFGDIGVRSERQYHGHATTQPDLRQ